MALNEYLPSWEWPVRSFLMGDYISPWLISARFIAISSWSQASWWKCWQEFRLQAESRDGVCSQMARNSWASGVHTWVLCRGHLITGAACSYQVFWEKHCLVLHTKCNHWRPFIFWEEIYVGCLLAESSPHSCRWLSKLLATEVDEETKLSSLKLPGVRFLRFFLTYFFLYFPSPSL